MPILFRYFLTKSFDQDHLELDLPDFGTRAPNSVSIKHFHYFLSW